MKPICIFFFCLAITSFGQSLSGNQLLEKAIAHHDPQNRWNTFKGKLVVELEMPNESNRTSVIDLNRAKGKFLLQVKKGDTISSYTLNGKQCEVSLNGNTEIPEELREKLRLNCEIGRRYKDYYTYLYGLPMKLKDPGTLIHEKVQRRTFKGKEYLVLKVNYEEGVGNDTWYFYFDPSTYAMEVYQFYHDESKNDGEYILLSGVEEINGIKMPKVRKWYYNKDGGYLGTDTLKPSI